MTRDPHREAVRAAADRTRAPLSDDERDALRARLRALLAVPADDAMSAMVRDITRTALDRLDRAAGDSVGDLPAPRDPLDDAPDDAPATLDDDALAFDDAGSAGSR